ncbi:TonB-dependent receptor [Mucilaginibacter arboris]|uniref:TonB-dependent receptor plug domain-containing protein n=1 Tax=Mucilaginibacter arboris TaxID=2682090 RepID=A0A7K1SUW7_9SPHI|nr:TonB-dependent receptor [Mucilaginibacter arboris]MVN21073.1 TonB-dependent receptor plug domain-containing protein [Mucilaginibacter arboris]
MNKIFTHSICAFIFIIFLVAKLSAQQTTISGTVSDKTSKEKLAGVTVTVRGGQATSTDAYGHFSFKTTRQKPFTLVISYVGYQTLEQQITGSSTDLSFELQQQGILGQEVVVAASRTPERILESPVSIERVSATAIQQAAAPSFYEALANLKGVEMSTQSLTFQSINTRGFNTNGNERFNQFVDGMDNQAPGLNFSIANIVGLTELDIDNAELLPGASSALYGSGGINGTLLMTSKSPFTYQGLSVQLKTGLNHVNDPQQKASVYNDYSMRYAKAFNNRFAFKVDFSYLKANDWQARNYTDYDRLNNVTKAGTRTTDPNYDGVNVYGDEINTTFGATAGFLNGQTVSRTGYNENALVDYGTKSIKTLGALHYKFNDNLEAIAQADYGIGTSVYTGSDRYSLKNFTLGQYKLEVKGTDFFLRGYTTQERSGDAYNATALGTLINEEWKPSTTWFTQYATAYNVARLGGQTDAAAQQIARSTADAGRPQPGSTAFQALKDDVTSKTIGPGGGAKFNDKSNLYNAEGMYNFSKLLNNVVDILVGANYRIYKLHSDGTLFDDLTRSININEVGAYAQINKKLFDDKLKLTGSIRYDKNQNFDGKFTPRISGVYTIAPNNNIRVSYQTGYRNPTTQNQYIDLLVRTNTRIIGGLPELLDKYNLNTNKGYTLQSFQQFSATGNPAVLQPYTFGKFNPESVQAYEVGYKGLITNKLLIDAYYYYNQYKNFISNIILIQNPTPGNPVGLANYQVFSTYANNPAKVKTDGFAVGLDYQLYKLNLTGNVSYNKLSSASNGYINQYNTPEYRYNLGINSSNIYKNIGFNVQYRWQEQFLWESPFATGTVPAFGTVDAQVSYKINPAKCTVKVGGSNILNKYYVTSYGNPQIGAVYYVSLLFDQLLK